MNDTEYLFNKDSFEKKNIARSSRNMRTHNGKSGAVKFPSDYMTKGQIKKMSGECKTYRMNEAISWEEFKNMPDDLKIAYIKAIREKFGAPDKYIAEMMGVNKVTFSKYAKCLCLSKGSDSGTNRKWNKDGFFAWRAGASDTSVGPSETPVEAEEDIIDSCPVSEEKPIEGHGEPQEAFYDVADIFKKTVDDERIPCQKKYDYPGPIAYTGHNMPVIPSTGTMTFINNNADDALAVIKTLLSNARVNLTVKWDCVFEDGSCCEEG